MYYDKEFLKQLDFQYHREIYARITLLTFDEQPIEYIEGTVTGGSINIDGTSSLRRTCNLSLVSTNLDINIYMLNLERKFILEIGLKNTINSNYPEIIWFKQGMFVTTSCSTARQTNSYQISINGKDKMCLLNGDVGGSMPYSVNFGVLEEVSKDGTTITYTKVKVKDIIKNAVEEFGNEFPYNIIINDLEESGLELLEYNGDEPIYGFRKGSDSNDQTFENLTLDGEMEVYYIDPKTNEEQKSALKNMDGSYFDSFTDFQEGSEPKISFKEGGAKEYTIVKFTYGDCVGYRQTDLVYPSDLIANVGETLTSVLDKITNMLVNFEYFYDIDGHFIFQKKKTYEKWGAQVFSENEEGKLEGYYENSKIKSDPFYNFEDNTLVISFNNTPDFNNVKNDFSIWGTRKGVSGSEIPIHLRFALDRKPKSYTTYKPDKVLVVEDKSVETSQTYMKYNDYPQYTYIAGPDGSWEMRSDKKTITCDWREIIYQMAKDYYKYRDTEKDFYKQIIENNKDENGVSLYPTGRTNYEQYYTDILGFWRDIYSPVGAEDIRIDIPEENKNPTGFFTQVLLSNNTYKPNKYYLKKKQYKIEKKYTIDIDDIDRMPVYELDSSRTFSEDKIYYERTELDKNENSYFSHEKLRKPQELKFWFDFLDTTGDLGKYSVRAIGQRPKDVNNSNVKSIYYRQTPNFIFFNPETVNKDVKILLDADGNEINRTVYYSELDTKTAYTYITSTVALDNCLSISTQGISAMEELQTYLNKNTYCNETATLTTIPIYYMEPNVRVAIKDEKSKVNGEYLVTKITLPLAYNGNMSLSVMKIVDDIY